MILTAREERLFSHLKRIGNGTPNNDTESFTQELESLGYVASGQITESGKARLALIARCDRSRDHDITADQGRWWNTL